MSEVPPRELVLVDHILSQWYWNHKVLLSVLNLAKFENDPCENLALHLIPILIFPLAAEVPLHLLF
jgi:hypothetical protein